jgi:hypothetical protein
MSDADPNTNGKEKAKSTLFQPGQIANPAGRPKGSRNKLGEQFIQALQQDFETNGVQAIATVREERPHEYLKVVASLLPKQIEIKEYAFDGVSDEQLAALVHAARDALGVAEGSGERASH